MLDDLRQQAADSFGDEELPPPPPPRSNRILGMTPLQTFIVALLLLILTCLLSSACLLATGRIVPPFLY
jgi:hypothetical protein